MDSSIAWFVIGFIALLCFGLAVLNKDLENRREQHDMRTKYKPRNHLASHDPE